MKNTFLKLSFITIAGVLILSCEKDEIQNPAPENKVTKKQVIENYANIAFANYTKAYEDAVVLETAIATFTATPTLANFNNAKDKWKLSRESYGTTEAFRFANGPIDDANGPEGLMNSWPMDENFVDYVDGAANAGIINDAVAYPTITKEILAGINAVDEANETNVSVGYHAIEFLLWGQDLTAPSINKPGQRPYTDYLTTGGTASNQARRATYLKVCADLLTDNLLYIVNEWKVGGAYRTTFLALAENVALKNMYLGITTLISSELPNERMLVSLDNPAEEDEHSCFSDNTHRDIILNAQGIANIYRGNYDAIDGASLEDLVKNSNQEAFDDTNSSLTSSLSKVNGLLNPFDLAIAGGVASVEGAKVKAAILQLKDTGVNLLNGATKIGITVN